MIQTSILLMILLLMVQPVHSQFLKNLKAKLSSKGAAKPTQKISGLDQKFKDWDMGEADIIAISVFADDKKKHRQNVGAISADGQFVLNLPDSLKTWIPISVYGNDCENGDEAKIVNPDVKLAWNQLHIFQEDNYLGAISPADPVEAAYNVNESGVNNGTMGKYYLWVYADGDASAAIDCTKVKEVTDGKETTYPKMPLEDKFDLQYKKGWNIVEVEILDNIWVGLTKHYTERTWKVVKELPGTTKWVFRPEIQE